MDESGIRDRIRKAVEKSLGIEIDREEFASAERMDDFLGMDSISAMEIVVALEQEFGLVFDDNMLNVREIGDLAGLESYLEKRL